MKYSNLEQIERLLEMGADVSDASLVRWLLEKYNDAQDELGKKDLRIAELERQLYNKLAADGR